MNDSKSGRPAVYGTRLKRTSVTLPIEHIEYLKALGGGNISNAIRKLVEQADAPIDKPQEPPTVSKTKRQTPRNRPTYIYGLCDPGSSTVRYVGKTFNVRDRLAQHLYKKRVTVNGMNPCATWIDSLKESGQRPDLIVLEETTEEEWEAKEQEWIKTLIDQGIELLNVSAGGLSGRWVKTYPAYDKPPVSKDSHHE